MRKALLLHAAARAALAAPATAFSRAPAARGFRASTARRLNRIMLEPAEATFADGVCTAVVGAADPRSKHVRGVLKAASGGAVRAGVVDTCRDDAAAVAWRDDGAMELTLRVGDGAAAVARSPVSLLLALPRPLQMARLLPTIAQMGVGSIVVHGASKVEPNYFGGHLLRAERGAERRALLVEGLSQSGDVALPPLDVRKKLWKFLDDELDAMYPPDAYRRVVAHPHRAGEPPAARMRNLAPPSGGGTGILLSVGPEGGWTDEELEGLRRRGFVQVALAGERVLRTDVAVVALLAQAHDRVEEWEEMEAGGGLQSS